MGNFMFMIIWQFFYVGKTSHSIRNQVDILFEHKIDTDISITRMKQGSDKLETTL